MIGALLDAEELFELYYEARDKYAARIGSIMNGEDTKNG